MAWKRREFLKGSVATFAAFSLPVAGRAAPRSLVAGAPVLVAVFLRGAADGLNLVVPHGDPTGRYYELRPTIQVPPGAELDLDGFHGLNPALADLLPLYQSGDLAVVHAAGSPHETRSHFEAQDYMERAAPGDPTVLDGWLNRSLGALGVTASYEGISINSAKVLALRGGAPSLAFAAISKFRLLGAYQAKRRTAIEAAYNHVAGTLLGGAVGGAFEAVDLVASVDTTTEVVYPTGKFGDAMRDAAALVKADIGVRVLTVDLGGWDTHSNEVVELGDAAGELGAAIAAFYEDLGTHRSRTLLLTMSEFGRTAGENGGFGTDHGHANVMFALGGGLAGGRVITRDGVWPGLLPEELYEGRDLAVTTDFRDVFAEILDRHLGIGDLSTILPNFTVDPGNYPGLFV
ncbi:MAG: DUF1501 domain-containing protein [Myxococcales bacterium]|nr:DUF1501 domain-containing protein [Myxococcales bacterium]